LSPLNAGGDHVTRLRFIVNGLVDRTGGQGSCTTAGCIPVVTGGAVVIPALPYGINPTSCHTSVTNVDVNFADGTIASASDQTFPRDNTSVLNFGTNPTTVGGWCGTYPFNGTEDLDGSGIAKLQPNVAGQNTPTNTNIKVSDDDNGAVL